MLSASCIRSADFGPHHEKTTLVVPIYQHLINVSVLQGIFEYDSLATEVAEPGCGLKSALQRREVLAPDLRLRSIKSKQ